MMNKNKRTMNLNGRMNYKFKTMNMQLKFPTLKI